MKDCEYPDCEKCTHKDCDMENNDIHALLQRRRKRKRRLEVKNGMKVIYDKPIPEHVKKRGGSRKSETTMMFSQFWKSDKKSMTITCEEDEIWKIYHRLKNYSKNNDIDCMITKDKLTIYVQKRDCV